MNTETQSTPEQLAKWREKFESRYDLAQLGTVYERYLNSDVREAWGNYVEAREDASQDNEQVMKLMEKAANISAQHARKMALEEAIVICNAVLAPTKASAASAAEVATHFRDGYISGYISGVNRCINRLELIK